MVLTAAQTAAFFEQPTQMAIPHATVVQLANEGISTVDDLIDFDKDTLDQVAENLRRPGDRIPNPDPNAAPGSTIARPPYTFGAKSQKRLLVACDLVRFYDTVGRPLTTGNIQWDPVMRNFAEQWKSLKDKKKDEVPEVPKITKALPIIKWTEAFDDYLHKKIGQRNIPLAYVTREDAAVPAVAPPLATNLPHSEEHGSVEGDLVARASHAHALYRDDNSAVYYALEEATRGTSYAASIKPFQRAKDGRAALAALRIQYAGNDKWEAEIKKQEQLLHTRVWKGQTNFSLEKFIAQHRNAYVSMQQCAEHVPYQLPNEHTRVGYLLKAIQCSDAGLQAAIAQINTDDGPNGKRSDFEATAAYLLPYDPVAKKRAQSNKRSAAEISDATGEPATVSSFGSKPGIGKTGVHFRYYEHEDYILLSDEQKLELKEWREANGISSKKQKKQSKKNGSRQRPKGKTKTVASTVAEEVAKQLKEAKAAAAKASKEDEEARAYIMSLIHEEAQSATPKNKKATVAEASTSTPTTTATALKSIIRRAKGSQA